MNGIVCKIEISMHLDLHDIIHIYIRNKHMTHHQLNRVSRVSCRPIYIPLVQWNFMVYKCKPDMYI